MAGFDFEEIAEDYLARRFPGGHRSVAGLARARLDWDEAYCRSVARHFDRADNRAATPALERAYRVLHRENLRQLRALLDAGLRVEPWLGDGQPYRDSARLRRGVDSSGVLYVYLTSAGHGPGGGAGAHPMREPSPVVLGGVRFSHNDVFRAVHDVFGHVMHGNGFGPRGEFRAAHCHMHMYPDEARPVLFAEQVAQISWFYFGPHLADPNGRVPSRGEPGYVPPAQRPYPEQKLLEPPDRLVEAFLALFSPP
ncbi:hypothetical protein BJF83_09605 [Nocardiopsis sp. CNR-923]|uniref:hypothetical protein n=1 Tax=Nocardiopsis sp. CNR-923 TaxID=1904965 RepID=UPI00095991E9|nr:hypothetical protein [Nocardiopsis sp. CNR-923]OLT29944.1 hypothetical protein BJF83_09605 [Nocardiopsis sp. CNR-923]